jgi:RNA polymerase sigma-70 factor (ECF subfamily)
LTPEQIAAEFPQAAAVAMRALSRFNSLEDSEDAVQDAVVAALKTKSPFDGRSKFSTWFTRVAINQRLMSMRYTKKRSQMLDVDALSNVLRSKDNPEADCAHREHLRSIFEELLRQKPLLWETFRLYYVEGIAVPDIAERQSISKSAVKARLHRAIVKLLRAGLAGAGPTIVIP